MKVRRYHGTDLAVGARLHDGLVSPLSAGQRDLQADQGTDCAALERRAKRRVDARQLLGIR